MSEDGRILINEVQQAQEGEVQPEVQMKEIQKIRGLRKLP